MLLPLRPRINELICMKKELILFLGALLALTLPVACSNDDEENDNLYSQIIEDKIPHQLMNQSDLPEWLLDQTNEMKSAPSYIPEFPERVYQLEWNGISYYYIHSPWNRMPVSVLYDEDGSMYILSSDSEKENFKKNSNNWKCIYIV